MDLNEKYDVFVANAF